MSPEEAVRRGVGLFRLHDRGLLEVRGSDRERWLDAQLTNRLPSPPRVPSGDAVDPLAGCYAFVLTPIGRIVADVHVIARHDGYWLETAAAAMAPLVERLEATLVADDVELVDRGAEIGHLALEGPQSSALLDAAVGTPVAIEPDAAAELSCAGVRVVAAAYGWSGESALQLLVPRGALDDVTAALRSAGHGLGLVEADAAVLEILRVEAGTPRYGAELDEQVLPAETGLLTRAVCFEKGCYTGQEVVARMHSRGRVTHHLVGLQFEAGSPPPPEQSVEVDGKRVGETTSGVLSPRAGPIALAFVRSPHEAPQTPVRVAGRAARVVPLPFVGGS